jgi:formylglycine-generating enzyme required for sulfatase activity
MVVAGKYEVTQGQWEVIMGNNPSRFKGNSSRPVEQVSWRQAREFSRRLNDREGGAKYRLPTEAAWEYAARAGSTAAYSFGDDTSRLVEYAWFNSNSLTATQPVGQRKANAWGLYDMHGNVWEWVEDAYGRYTPEPVTDPKGIFGGSHRVRRGGSWGSPMKSCRVANRGTDTPDSRGSETSFRLVMMQWCFSLQLSYPFA